MTIETDAWNELTLQKISEAQFRVWVGEGVNKQGEENCR